MNCNLQKIQEGSEQDSIKTTMCEEQESTKSQYPWYAVRIFSSKQSNRMFCTDGIHLGYRQRGA